MRVDGIKSNDAIYMAFITVAQQIKERGEKVNETNDENKSEQFKQACEA